MEQTPVGSKTQLNPMPIRMETEKSDD